MSHPPDDDQGNRFATRVILVIFIIALTLIGFVIIFGIKIPFGPPP